jgi:hypothetical protein
MEEAGKKWGGRRSFRDKKVSHWIESGLSVSMAQLPSFWDSFLQQDQLRPVLHKISMPYAHSHGKSQT